MDERLRELERRWRASGALDDEVAWLGERLRVGDLAPERARLAAWLGHPAAEAVTGVRFGDEPLRSASDVRRAEAALWEGVAVAGPEAARRALLGDARRLHRGVRVALGGRAEQADVTAIVGWLRAAAQVLEAAQGLIVAAGSPDEVGPLMAADSTLQDARQPRLPARFDPEGAQAYRDLPAALARLASSFVLPPRAWVATRTWWRFRALQQALRGELAPWALGLGDPLRDEAGRRLDRVAIASPCPARFEDMRPVGGDARVRSCARCQLNVHDLSALSREDAEALLATHDGARPCVRLYRRRDGRVLTRDCPVGLEERLEPATEFVGLLA